MSDGRDTGGSPGLLAAELANLPERAILDEARLAGALHVTGRTIRRMVRRRELPPPVRLAGRACWFVGRVLAHIDAAAERAEREAQREADRIARYSP